MASTSLCADDALDQHLDLPPGRFSTEQAGVDHATVVEHEEVARLQPTGQLTNRGVGDALSLQHQQARRGTVLEGHLRDAVARQLVVVVGKALGHGVDVDARARKRPERRDSTRALDSGAKIDLRQGSGQGRSIDYEP